MIWFDSIDFLTLSDNQIEKLISEEAQKLAKMHASGEMDVDVNVDQKWWLAPECFLPDYQPTLTTDIWAFGAHLYKALTGNLPFGDEGGKNQALGTRLPLIQGDFPQEIKRLTYHCLDKNPNRRPTADQITNFSITPPNVKNAEVTKKTNSKRGLIIGFSITIIVLGVVAFMFIPNSTQSSEKNDELTDEEMREDIEQSRFMPLQELTDLANSGNSDALFLLSRLYFNSKSDNDICEDSILEMKAYYNITEDNDKAHRLLQLAVENDPQNYKASYELGLNYYAGQARDPKYKRDINQALQYFKETQINAHKAEDLQYEILASSMIQNIEKR